MLTWLLLAYALGVVFFGVMAWIIFPDDRDVTVPTVCIEVVFVLAWPVVAPVVLYCSWKDKR